jgi:acyl-CoA synthetase (AMP-forming)/AMP-acid ligase II
MQRRCEDPKADNAEGFTAHPWRVQGFYFTGDGCRRDAGGMITITGRVDDVINVSGHRVGTAEVEAALASHGACIEAAVVGCARCCAVACAPLPIARACCITLHPGMSHTSRVLQRPAVCWGFAHVGCMLSVVTASSIEQHGAR